MSSIVKLSGRQGDLRGLEKFVVRPLQAGKPDAGSSGVKERNDPVARARRRAKEIEAEALEAAAEIRQAAWNEGYAKGREAAETRHQGLLSEAQNAIEEFEREKNDYWESIEPELVRLAVEIAEKIIRNELSAKPEIVLDIAKSAIRQVRQRESVRLRVNPADMEVVKSQRTEILESADGARHLEVVDDRRVDRGGAMIESDDGTLDARIATQLSETEKALMEAADESASHED